MVSLALASCLISPQAQAEPPARKASKTGTIREHRVSSEVLKNERLIWVWTPEEYAKNPAKKYPVLYMHDGQNCFDGVTSYIPNGEWRADETAEALIRAKLVEPFIIVGVSNAQADRANEYLPTQVSRTANGQTSTMGGRADDYGRFLTDEVMPLIRKEYRVDPRPEVTGLLGSSFGGIITLHLGMTRPDAFRRLGVLSPSLWWDNRVMLKRAEDHQNFRTKGFRMWVDMGGLEGADSVLNSRKLAKILESKGLKPAKDFVYVEEALAEHNEFAWARRLGEIMMFLYPARR